MVFHIRSKFVPSIVHFRRWNNLFNVMLWCHSVSPAAGSSCIWCRIPCHTRNLLQKESAQHCHWWTTWQGLTVVGACCYLQCSLASAEHGETTVMAGKASHQPSHCSRVDELGCTEETAADLDPKGPVGSRGPEEEVGGVRKGWKGDIIIIRHCTDLFSTNLIHNLKLSIVTLVVDSWLIYTCKIPQIWSLWLM